MAKLQFSASIKEINTQYILNMPKDVSSQLSSRGMTMLKGNINGFYFEAPVEPDGMGGHWFAISEPLFNSIGLSIGDNASLEVEEMDTWNEPEVPEDIFRALIGLGLEEQWNGITSKSRWEWIRWIRFTNNPETRKKRIDIACSMLGDGKKRPCCFDHSRCTDMSVSRSGVLLGLDQNHL
ncbi:MAG: DUF1905 domain-containing protein [Clostridia bacterium]|nr:DUF1905 domain-containing protein [Clostridia bacterium]